MATFSETAARLRCRCFAERGATVAHARADAVAGTAKQTLDSGDQLCTAAAPLLSGRYRYRDQVPHTVSERFWTTPGEADDAFIVYVADQPFVGMVAIGKERGDQVVQHGNGKQIGVFKHASHVG